MVFALFAYIKADSAIFLFLHVGTTAMSIFFDTILLESDLNDEEINNDDFYNDSWNCNNFRMFAFKG
jgi:hypothetical protein